MTTLRPWHFALALVPVVGWLLLAALLLDARGAEPQSASTRARSAAIAPPSRRVAAAAIDIALLALPATLLPPAFAWAIAAVYLVFRDAGPAPFGLGKRWLGLKVESATGTLTYTESFARNGLLLVPYLGALVELLLVTSGRVRLGDRLAGCSVVRVR